MEINDKKLTYLSENKVHLHIITSNKFFELGAWLKIQHFISSNLFSDDCVHLHQKPIDVISGMYDASNEGELNIILTDDMMIETLALMLCDLNIKNTRLVDIEYISCKILRSLINNDDLIYQDKYFTLHIKVVSGLSNRERKICKFLYYGMNSKLIASIFGVGPKTISAYINNIITKTGCRNKIHLYKAILRYHRLLEVTHARERYLD